MFIRIILQQVYTYKLQKCIRQAEDIRVKQSAALLIALKHISCTME